MTYAPEGDPQTARYVLVGEAPAANELREGRPFCGPAGHVLDQCLEKAGILRSECYLTNVFSDRVWKPKGKQTIFDYRDQNIKLWQPYKGFTEAADMDRVRLANEFDRTTANVIIPLGNVALSAICDLSAIMKWRGSILTGTRLSGAGGRKCIPTIHPANALHGSALSRYPMVSDLKRAKEESAFPEIRPVDYDFILNPTFTQCMSFLQALWEGQNHGEPICVDIEIAAGQVSYICFATSPKRVMSIPYSAGDWTLTQECELWRATADVLESLIPKIFQNGVFDIQVLLQVHGIMVQGVIEDTMIAHHIAYPDFPKGLAFLTSIRTKQPFYKDMVKHGDVEKVDG